jgi:hypothetical protein
MPHPARLVLEAGAEKAGAEKAVGEKAAGAGQASGAAPTGLGDRPPAPSRSSRNSHAWRNRRSGGSSCHTG